MTRLHQTNSQPPLDASSLDDNESEKGEDLDNDFLGILSHTENYDVSSDFDRDEDDDGFLLATTKPFTPSNAVSYNKLTIRAATLGPRITIAL